MKVTSTIALLLAAIVVMGNAAEDTTTSATTTDTVVKIPDLPPTLTQTAKADPLVDMVAIVSAVARGAITGYRIGMYKATNYVVNPKCFGIETQQLFVQIFDVSKFDFGTEILAIQNVSLMISDNCEFDESVYDYLTFCYNGEACEVATMVQTLLTKIFQVTTVANDIAQIFMEGLPIAGNYAGW